MAWTLVGVLCLAAAAMAAPAPGMRLIAFNETSHVWMTREQIDKELVFTGKHHNFMDITDAPTPLINTASKVRAFPTQPTQKTLVESLINSIDIDIMRRNLIALSNFYTRYYTSDTGLQAAQWIYSELVAMKGARDDISVQYFDNTFRQPSVIARIEGQHDGPAAIVILGSHLDSVGSTPTGQSPGADDDGSGTIVNLETFRVIVESGIVLPRAIEFQYYAAEEVGLLGSQAIANDYSNRGVEVYAMMQLDMTMYQGTAPIAISPITDFTNPDLTAFIRILIDTYLGVNWADSRCGYGCSDHASWFRTGVPSVFTFETIFSKSNPNIHSARDVIGNLNFEHGREFVKLAIAHIVELGSFSG